MRPSSFRIASINQSKFYVKLVVSSKIKSYGTIGKREHTQRQVVMSRSAIDGIIGYSKGFHLNEAILILQVKTTRQRTIIECLFISPFALSEPYYAGYSYLYMPPDN